MKNSLLLLTLTLALTLCEAQGVVSFSFDDPNVNNSGNMSWQERNQKILQSLQSHELHAVLFVCGMRVNSVAGKALLGSWDAAGHSLGNHSYSHPNFGSKQVNVSQFEHELLQTDSLIAGYKHVAKLFRFPFLKEGGTAAKRDSMRAILAANGYRNGYVSIDASDWYIDQLLVDSLKKNPRLDLMPFRDFYIAHILERAAFYDSLSTALTGRKVQHVLLLHHNLVSALFLDQLIAAFAANGWAFHDAFDAYRDPMYAAKPEIAPAGESIVWALAKQSGKYEKVLRYPAEDATYEAAKRPWLKR